ncbi:uncharacterized protein LOC122535164 [Frieseomelitta varia]|uniref:uncharacterized protein LOC122535164 n=1 Tax=Frieseomelitta varia TaxID=561572 RepID=UPI001CB6B0DB|nr:uncharacterized protein LOC122535164 [Frieseomelitta varia]
MYNNRIIKVLSILFFISMLGCFITLAEALTGALPVERCNWNSNFNCDLHPRHFPSCDFRPGTFNILYDEVIFSIMRIAIHRVGKFGVN